MLKYGYPNALAWVKTVNSGVISSDLKGHPEQNRVLSLREILRLSTLDHDQWKRNYDFTGIPLGKWDDSQSFSARLVREVIGESIPPLAMKCMVDHLLQLEKSIEYKAKNGPSSVTENGPKAKKAYPKTSLDKLI